MIEDCAHAIETTVDGRHAGTFGAFGAFSFYVTKNVVTAEGGMLLTSDADAAARARCLSLHGLSADAWKRFSDDGFKHYDVDEPGFKYNMTDLQAALGLRQLARVERNLERRDAIWARYDAAFADLPTSIPAPSSSRHATCTSSLHALARPRPSRYQPRRGAARAPREQNRHRCPLPGGAPASVLSRATRGRRRITCERCLGLRAYDFTAARTGVDRRGRRGRHRRRPLGTAQAQANQRRSPGPRAAAASPATTPVASSSSKAVRPSTTRA